MEKRRNSRILLTKQRIHDALLQMLLEKPLQQISIRELCTRAGINRTTFYNHYGSQYDVLSEIASEYLDEIERTIEHADAQDRFSVQRRVTLVLHFVQDNLTLSSLLFNNNIDEQFAPRLFSLPKIGEMLGQALADVPDERTRRTIVTFAIFGSYRVLQEWINDPERSAPEDEARRILGLARQVCNWRD